MNVNKTLFILFILPIFCFSQTKEQDAYFFVNKNHKEYKLIINKYELKITGLNLYNRKQYEQREKFIENDKKEGKYRFFSDYKRPHSYLFNVIKNRKETITHCRIHELNLNIVDYNWLIYNSWKPNNPNILFKNLYFLFKVKKDKYIKYKVERTVIAY